VRAMDLNVSVILSFTDASSQILREFPKQGPENTFAIVALEYPNPPSLENGRAQAD
jgi:hypothetical protein